MARFVGLKMKSKQGHMKKAVDTAGVDDENVFAADFALNYQVKQAGWATLVIDALGQHHTFVVSYLHDSLAQLTDAVLALITGESARETVIFMEEPGELQLTFNLVSTAELARDHPVVNVQLEWFTDWVSWNMSASSKVLQRFCVPLYRVALAVYTSLEMIYSTLGLSGYKKAWMEHDFPLHAYGQLAKQLRPLQT